MLLILYVFRTDHLALVTNWCALPWEGYVREGTFMKSDQPGFLDMSWSRTSTDMQTRMGSTHKASALDKELGSTKEGWECEKQSSECAGFFSPYFDVTLCICSTLYILSHTLMLNDKHISLLPLMYSFCFTQTFKSICVLCLRCAFGRDLFLIQFHKVLLFNCSVFSIYFNAIIMWPKFSSFSNYSVYLVAFWTSSGIMDHCC